MVVEENIPRRVLQPIKGPDRGGGDCHVKGLARPQTKPVRSTGQSHTSMLKHDLYNMLQDLGHDRDREEGRHQNDFRSCLDFVAANTTFEWRTWNAAVSMYIVDSVLSALPGYHKWPPLNA